MNFEISKQFFSLRSTLEWLKREKYLIETDKEVDPDLEITGLQKHMDGGPPILFNNVKGKPHARAVTNMFSSMEIIDKMFNFENPKDRTIKLAKALNNPLKPIKISGVEAPCQEHVITDDLDVNKWITAIRHTDLEPELTIGSGIRCVVGDYFEGGSDLGYNRMNFRWVMLELSKFLLVLICGKYLPSITMTNNPFPLQCALVYHQHVLCWPVLDLTMLFYPLVVMKLELRVQFREKLSGW